MSTFSGALPGLIQLRFTASFFCALVALVQSRSVCFSSPQCQQARLAFCRFLDLHRVKALALSVALQTHLVLVQLARFLPRDDVVEREARELGMSELRDHEDAATCCRIADIADVPSLSCRLVTTVGHLGTVMSKDLGQLKSTL